MIANINEAIQKIKSIGSINTRIVPMEGQTITGSCQIEIKENGLWSPVVTGVTNKIAENIIAQATNRVILG